MDETIQFAPKLNGFQGGSDTTKQAIGLLDDLSNSFEERLSNAQERHKDGANLAGKKQKIADKPKQEQTQKRSTSTKQIETKEGDESAALSNQAEVRDVENIVGSFLEVKPPITDSEAPVASEMMEEVQVSEELRQFDTQTSPVAETSRESLDLPLISGEVTSELANPETVEGAPLELLDPEENSSVPVDAAPVELVETAISEPGLVTTDEVIDPQAAPTDGLPQAEASPLPQDIIASEALPPPVQSDTPKPPAPTVEKLSTELIEDSPKGRTTAESAALPKEPFSPEIEELKRASPPLERTALESAPAKAALTDEVPEDFHAIRSDPKEVVVRLDAQETEQVLRGLHDIAQNTHVQAPVVEKVSQEVLDGLKGEKSGLAKDIEAARGDGKQGANVERFASNELRNLPESKELQASRSRFDNPRMEKLKSRVIQQVRFQLRMAMRGKASEIRLQLQPEFLGKVKVKLLIEGDVAKASFTVDNQSVKEVLQRSISSLQKALADQGIDVSSVEVNVADDQAGQSQGGSSENAEDQAAAREYVASFRRFDDQEDETIENVATEGDSDKQVLNIVA